MYPLLPPDFTFQYGSIQMELDQFISELEEIFTFQYGSIQMGTPTTPRTTSAFYIPIWFYSNGLLKLNL